MSGRIGLLLVVSVLGLYPGCSGRAAKTGDVAANDLLEMPPVLQDSRFGARGRVEDADGASDSGGQLLSEMALSYMSCRAALESGWDCCQFEDGLWVLKDHDDCPYSGVWCGCEAGFVEVLFSEPGCKWGLCVAGYPGTCEPKYMITGEDARECHDCPPEAPFWCFDGEVDNPCGFCTDCPCPMLEETVGPECECGCSCGALGVDCYEDEECPNHWCIPHDDSWTGKLCGFT